jgi:ribosome-binding factor A
MAVKRTDKLNSEFKKNIAEIISTKIKNPNITEIVSVLRVEATGDLKFAKVFLSIFSLDDSKKKITFNAITSARAQIRHELSSMMRIRTVPELNFVLEDSLEHSTRITELLNQIKEGTNDK